MGWVIFQCDEEALTTYDDICIELETNDKYQNVQPFVKRYENYILAYADILYVSDVIGSKLSELYKLNELSKLITIYKDINIPKVVHNIINSINSINSAYVNKAASIITPILDYSIHISQYLNEDWYIAKVKNRSLSKFADRCDWSTCLRNSGLDSKKFGEVILTLVKREEIIEEPVERGEGQSRKTTLYIVKTPKYI